MATTIGNTVEPKKAAPKKSEPKKGNKNTAKEK